MEFNALIPELAVTDCAASLDFYCDILGFEIAFDRPEEGFAFLTMGDAQLMLDQIDMGRTFELEDAPFEYPLGRGVNFQIRVDTIEPMVDALTEANIEFFIPLEERWYRRGDFEVGNRQFVVMDPDGYLLRFFEELGERALV